MRTPRRVKAWLVTWEWIGDHAKRDDKIVAILNPRLSETKVKEIVELLYMQEGYSLSEKLTCALHKNEIPTPRISSTRTVDGRASIAVTIRA